MKNEILLKESEGYTILRERKDDGGIQTYVVVPLEDFPDKKNENK